jgi:hypothetical protein
MTARRKRDDLEDGALYRVVQRAAGSDDEWEHSAYGTLGKPRTYMTLGAARAQKTRFEREHAQRLEWLARRSATLPAQFSAAKPLEFAVQRAPVTAWEIVP